MWKVSYSSVYLFTTRTLRSNKLFLKVRLMFFFYYGNMIQRHILMLFCTGSCCVLPEMALLVEPGIASQGVQLFRHFEPLAQEKIIA